MSEVLFKCRFKVPWHSSKKNEKMPARRGRRMFIMKTEDAKYAEGWMLSHLAKAKIASNVLVPIACDIQAQFKFYFPESVYYTKKNVKSETLPDLSNLCQLPEDCLQKIKIIKNDNKIESLDGSRRLPIKGDEYFLEITLFKY
jgi:Holliday junction resolvase RusA-like endonuclease